MAHEPYFQSSDVNHDNNNYNALYVTSIFGKCLRIITKLQGISVHFWVRLNVPSCESAPVMQLTSSLLRRVLDDTVCLCIQTEMPGLIAFPIVSEERNIP